MNRQAHISYSIGQSLLSVYIGKLLNRIIRRIYRWQHIRNPMIDYGMQIASKSFRRISHANVVADYEVGKLRLLNRLIIASACRLGDVFRNLRTVERIIICFKQVDVQEVSGPLLWRNSSFDAAYEMLEQIFVENCHGGSRLARSRRFAP